jgi:predicted XRE-type DNA-binding protein
LTKQHIFDIIKTVKGDTKTMTNKDLSVLVNQTIKDNGINKTFISDKLGVTRQQIDNLLNKKQFSIDDANKILNIIGYEIDNISIKKLK